MDKQDFVAISQAVLERIGTSLAHWTNYLASVNRTKVLSEYAIRYATSEYLEVECEKHRRLKYDDTSQKNAIESIYFKFDETSQKNTIGKAPRRIYFKLDDTSQKNAIEKGSSAEYCLKEYDYEHSYPCYISKEKKADLFFSLLPEEPKDNEASVVFSNYIEFKYIKKTSNRKEEFSSDIRRLAVHNKNDSSSASFFIVFGLKSCMFAEPERLEDTTDKNKRSMKQYYGELLSFDLNNPECKINESLLTYVGDEKTWELESGFNDLSQDDDISSILVYTNNQDKQSLGDSVLIYIWMITVNNSSPNLE